MDAKPQNTTPCCIALAAVGTVFRKLCYRSNYAVAPAADPNQAATAADPMAHCAFPLLACSGSIFPPLGLARPSGDCVLGRLPLGCRVGHWPVADQLVALADVLGVDQTGSVTSYALTTASGMIDFSLPVWTVFTVTHCNLQFVPAPLTERRTTQNGHVK